MKYRKKPVVIEAWQWLFNENQEEDPPWVLDAMNRKYGSPNSAAFWPDGNRRDDADPNWTERPHIAIETLEGTHYAIPGDFIIQGVKGELYPCKPDIFRLTYEKVEA